MSKKSGSEGISRRQALSLLGRAGALGLAAPPMLLTASDAGAETVPPAFNQVDKPIPGEKNPPQREPQDKPIPGNTGTRRRFRRKRPVARGDYRHKRRSQPVQAQPPASEDKPK
jgi:hypothetical protein